ncbi:MAG TPA: phage major capsid protein [bacterium]|nr:phage major capsid protein [bacterium]
MSKLTDLRGQLDAARNELAAIFKEAGEDMDMSKVTVIEGDSKAKVEYIGQVNDKIDDYAKQLEEFNALDAMRLRADELGQVQPHPGHIITGRRDRSELKSLGELFVESDAYKGRQGGSHAPGPLSVLDLGPNEIKATLFETSAGWAPESVRTGRVVEDALRPIQLIDLIPTAATTQAAIVYMEETTATSGAATRAEGAAYVASTLALTERSKTVRSIGTSIPITDEQLEDVAQAESYVNGRLGFFVRQHLDDQLLNGTDVAPQLDGILGFTGLQTQAKGADPTPDTVHKAMTKIRVTGRAFPSAFVVHSNDWQQVRLLTTADGIYIWGSPSEAGPERIWGLPVVHNEAIAEGTGLVGDFSDAMIQLFIRRGLEVQLGYDDGDFIEGKRTVRAGLRACLVGYRGEAFCTTTGI